MTGTQPPHPYARNIPRFFAYRILFNFMLFLPIWVIFLQRAHGLSLTEVTFVDFAFWMTMVLTEVPTGAAADTLGRKQSRTGLSYAFVVAAGGIGLAILINQLLWRRVGLPAPADLTLLPKQA